MDSLEDSRADPWHYERMAWGNGCSSVVGVDEAGRGCLAGPVVAAAVMIYPGFASQDIRDSKLMTPAARDRVYGRIIAEAAAVGVGVVEAEVIDEINILRSTHAAMKAALQDLGKAFDFILVDGLPVPGLPACSLPIVKGDRLSVSIGAASIIAKVTRDRIMMRLANEYPVYCFAENKGYGTKQHIEALERYGPCAIHRKTFAPVSERIADCRLPGLGQVEAQK